MRPVRPLRRCKTRRVSDRSRSAQGRSAPARPRARIASHVHRLHQGRRVRCVHFLGSTRRAERHHTDHQSTSHQIPRKPCEPSHNHLHGRRHRRDSHRSANLVVRSARSRVGRWQRRCRRAMPREHARIGVFSAVAAQTSVCFRAVRAITRGRVQARSALMRPDHEKAITSISRRFSQIASRARRGSQCRAGGITFAVHMDGRRQRWHGKRS